MRNPRVHIRVAESLTGNPIVLGFDSKYCMLVVYMEESKLLI